MWEARVQRLIIIVTDEKVKVMWIDVEDTLNFVKMVVIKKAHKTLNFVKR